MTEAEFEVPVPKQRAKEASELTRERSIISRRNGCEAKFKTDLASYDSFVYAEITS